MALGVEGMRAGRVVRKAIFLTLGTAIFIFCLTLVYESMRAVMDVGGACASGGAYEIRQACPKGVGWIMPVGIFGMFFAGIFTFLGVFDEGGPRPYVFAWSALFLALGWNFLDYGFDAPGGGTEAGWLICGFVFVAMGGAPLLLLLMPHVARWSLWGPNSQRADDHLHPYKPPPLRVKTPARIAPKTPANAASTAPATAPTPWAPMPGTAVSTIDLPDPVSDSVGPAEDAPSTPKGNLAEQLQTLADLRERGMLDEDEYERAKRAVLGEDGAS
jgi:hypothetical protein